MLLASLYGMSILCDANIFFSNVFLLCFIMDVLVSLQSYGGFCAMTYLSFAPEGLKQVLLTGGIPPIGSGCTADAVYRACFEQVVKQNEKYYQRFPQDIHIVQEVVKYLAESEGGGVRKFLYLAISISISPPCVFMHEF